MRAHLEGVSIRAFTDRPGELRAVIGKQHGLYALYSRGKLYYVGLAQNLFVRLKQHTRDKHKGRWDQFNAYVTETDGIVKELESLALRVIMPSGNKVSGRFARSRNLMPELAALIEGHQAREAASLLAGKSARRARRKAKGLSAGSRLALIATTRRPLWGSVGGYDYSATLLKRGVIRFDGEDFESPSAAAEAATGSRRNGWGFWRYKDRRGVWRPIRDLEG